MEIVLDSARICASLSKHVTINRDAIEAYMSSIDRDALTKEVMIGYPLQFGSLIEEVNFLAVLQLLNIGFVPKHFKG